MIIWGIEWGEKVEALQAMQAKGKRVPALENMPRYRPDLAIYLRAYLDCSNSRTERGVIPFPAVAKWAEVFEVDIPECWEVLKVVDTEVNKWRHTNSAKSR